MRSGLGLAETAAVRAVCRTPNKRRMDPGAPTEMMTDASHAAVSGASPTEPPRNVPSKRCVVVPQVELCACRRTAMLTEEERM